MKGPGGPGNPASSSAQKRKRGDKGTILTDEDLGFHTALRKLPVDKKSVEIYVHIKSKNTEKPIKRLNRWLLEKHISSITKSVTKASFNRDGDLILKVKGEDEAEKLIKTGKLGEWPVEITRHATLNISKGVIFSLDMCWQQETDIVAALQDRCNVKEVYIPKKRKNNGNQETGAGQEQQMTPTGIVILTFGQVEPPTVIPYGFEKITVKPYIPNPMKCVLCQELGHTKKRCTNGYILCRECGYENGTDHRCQQKRCVNCKTTGHAANDRNCPSYLRAKEIERIMVLEKKSRFEARKHFYESYGSLEKFMSLRGLTTAEILKRAVVNNNQQTTEEHNTAKRQIHQKPNTSQPSPPMQTTTTVTIQDKAKETKSVEKQQGKEEVKPCLRNSFKLRKFKPFNGGITYYLETSFQEGKKPYNLDLSKFKGKGIKYTDELDYLKRALEDEAMMKAIQVELKKNLNNPVLQITNEHNQIYLKTSGTIDTESSDESENSDYSMDVNVDEENARSQRI